MSTKLRNLGLILAGLFVTAASGPCTPKPQPHKWTFEEVQEAAVLVRPVELQTDSRFSLRRVLEQILRTSGPPSPTTTPEALLQGLLDSFRMTQAVNPVSGLAMRLDQRNEATITAQNLLTRMVPIGLFNRIDQMTENASDCGEYRIVFAHPDREFLLIFEARLPNGDGLAGCGRIARLWQKLGSMTAAQQLDALDDFFFDGFENFKPAVHALHYGPKLGQIRSNSLEGTWMLREWKVDPTPGKPAFVPHPLGSPTPLTEFYADSNPNSLNPQLEATERAGFHDAFVTQHAGELFDSNIKTPLEGVTREQVIIATMGAKIDLRFLEFQSNAQHGDIPVAGSRLAPRLPSLTSPDGLSSMNPVQLMNRAGAITCGGCHGFTANGSLPIGRIGGVNSNWPSVVAFKHIGDEADSAPDAGKNIISDALRRFFIPYRRANMVAFLNQTETMRRVPAVRTNPYDDEIVRLFYSIVRGDQPVALQAQRARYEALFTERTRRDLITEGYFVRSRRSH